MSHVYKLFGTCFIFPHQKEWLDKFEQAKKARFVQEQQKRESASQTERSPSRPTYSESLESPVSRELLLVVN